MSHGDRHTLSVVVPVYRGAKSLPGLVAELSRLRTWYTTPDGHETRVEEVLLVHDCGPDDSDAVIRDLAAEYDWVRPVWLSRNFGQHASTLAGMACSAGDWVATVDEDGQHDPADLAAMLDRAMAERADVVYAEALNAPPHGAVRNLASRAAKSSIRWLTGNQQAASFNSFRLVLGDIARSVAAFSGSGVYLDVAMGWVSRKVVTCPVTLRQEYDRPSGYSFRSLLSHYWRMVITGGTRLLRMVSLAGLAMALLGIAFATYVVGAEYFGDIPVPGWTSVMVVILLSTGAILFSLGVIAEYIGVAVNMAMGRPLYLIVGDRATGPHGRGGTNEA